MASMESEMLLQCTNLVYSVINSNIEATIQIKCGNLSFDYSSHAFGGFRTYKRLSPSQIRRNEDRKLNFLKNRVKIEPSHCTDLSTEVEAKVNCETQTETTTADAETSTEVQSKVNCETQTENITADAETSTEIVTFADAEANTEVNNMESLEDNIGVDENGVIKPNGGEILIEMNVSHDAKTLKDIQNIISSNLQMKSIGRPWLANTGRLFKTVGFRTMNDEYEKWRTATFNWQNSGVRKVATSRLYR